MMAAANESREPTGAITSKSLILFIFFVKIVIDGAKIVEKREFFALRDINFSLVTKV